MITPWKMGAMLQQERKGSSFETKLWMRIGFVNSMAEAEKLPSMSSTIGFTLPTVRAPLPISFVVLPRSSNYAPENVATKMRWW